ncbi:MAG: hypothetical protein SGILL_010388 [Bacillariaceae sp.]
MSVEESFEGVDDQTEWIEGHAENALFLMAAIKCGNSMARALQLYRDMLCFLAKRDSSGFLYGGYTESEKRYAFAWNNVSDYLSAKYYGRGGLMLLLQRFAPCDCLKPLVLEETRSYRGICLFCIEKEPSPRAFATCSACKLARYCSRDCQKEHWSISRDGTSHKRCCKEIQKILALDIGEE